MVELNKIPFTEVERLANSGRALTVLPVGVVEEHGAHLPLGLDSFAAEVYARSAAPHLENAGYKVVVAPTINYGLFINAIINFVIVAFAMFLVVRQTVRFLPPPPPPAPSTRDCPYCLSAVPLKATRCAHCTSDLTREPAASVRV